MALFGLFRKPPVSILPDVADLLVLLGLTASAKDCAHAFYQKQYRVIDAAVELRSAIKNDHPDLERLLTITQAPAKATADRVRGWLARTAVSGDLVEVLDSQMPAMHAAIATMLEDRSCP